MPKKIIRRLWKTFLGVEVCAKADELTLRKAYGVFKSEVQAFYQPFASMKDNLLKLCKKKNKCLAHFDAPDAHRTSAHLDRIMKIMERHAINSQMFHATVSSTSRNFRALALLYNFSPSCPAVTKEYPELVSPAARLNGFVYSESWLENLLTAASLNGERT